MLPLLASLLLCLATPVLAQDLHLDPAELSWLEQHATPLASTTPTGDTHDLAFLDEFVGDARVVGLGEATHGNLEFSQVKHRLVQYLVEELGFTHLVFESGYHSARQLDRYVLTGEGDPTEALRALRTRPFYTKEVLDLIEDLRALNAADRGPVRIAGMDLQGPPDPAMREVLAFLQAHDPTFVPQAREAYAFAKDLAPKTSNWASLAPEWRAGARRVLAHLEAERGAYLARASQDEVAWAQHNARLVLQGAHRYYDNVPSRDESMADNVTWLLEHDPDARLILWAHNSHIKEHEAHPRYDTRLGEVLAERYGDAYRSIGFALYAGAHRGFDLDTWEPVVTPLEPLPDGYVEPQLQRLGMPLFFLPLEGTDDTAEAEWLGEVQGMRSIGIANQRTGIVPVVLREAFDGLIFIERVTPNQPLLLPERGSQ